MEKSRGDCSGVVRGPEAEDICISYGPSPQSCSEDISVHTHNSCNSATEWVESTGAVVRLGLYADTPVIIPGDYSRVVMEYA